MSNMRPPARSPYQQGNMSTPTGLSNQRSPKIKKHNSSPAWGSGAIMRPLSNCPRPGQFTSPQPQYNFTSPPQVPHQQQFTPYRSFMTSPRHYGNSFGSNGNTFRTPQPMARNPSPQKSWSCDRNFRPMSHKKLNMKSPRRDPNSNPGGCNDIALYYHPSMLADPWQKMTPVPVTHTPSATT